MKKLFTLFLAFSFLASISAQREETLLRGFRLTGVWGGSNHGIIDLDNEFSTHNEGYFAFEINRDFLIGWSGYGDSVELDTGGEAKINGNDLFLGYTFNSDNVIHPAAYLKFGRGTLDITGEAEDNVFVWQPSVGAEVNITRWFRLGLEGGYRFVNNVNTPGYTEDDFSSPFVGLRLKFGWSWGR